MALVLLAVMATALPLTALAICAALTMKRRRKGVSFAVPLSLGVLILMWLVAMAGFELRDLDESLGQPWRLADPATKATVLSLALSETLNCSALFVLLGLPVFGLASFVDRRLRRAGPQPRPE